MYIKFGSLQLKLLIPIIFPIFLLIRNIILVNEISSSCISSGFNDFLSLTFFGVLNLIMKYQSKSSNTKQEQRNINCNNKEENNYPLRGYHAEMKKDIDNNLKTSKMYEIKQFLFFLLISCWLCLQIIYGEILIITMNSDIIHKHYFN